MSWQKSVVKILSIWGIMQQVVLSACQCTYDQRVNYRFKVLDVDAISSSAKTISGAGKDYIEVACPATVTKYYTASTMNKSYVHSNQLTNEEPAGWGFKIDFAQSPVSPTRTTILDDGVDDDFNHETVFVTREDANGKIYAMADVFIFIYQKNWHSQELAKRRITRYALWDQFCRYRLLPKPDHGAPIWTQPTGQSMEHPAESDKSFPLVTLYKNGVDCDDAWKRCIEREYATGGFTYSVEWNYSSKSIPLTDEYAPSIPFSFKSTATEFNIYASGSLNLPSDVPKMADESIAPLTFKVCATVALDTSTKVCSDFTLNYIGCTFKLNTVVSKYNGVNGSDTKALAATTDTSYAVQFNSLRYEKSSSSCADFKFEFITDAAIQNFDPLSSSTIDPNEPSWIYFNDFSLWISGFKVTVEVNMLMQVTFEGSPEVVLHTDNFTIHVTNCLDYAGDVEPTTQAISPAASYTTHFGANFKPQIGWDEFKIEGLSSLCPIDRYQITIDYSKSAQKQFTITASSGDFSINSNDVPGFKQIAPSDTKIRIWLSVEWFFLYPRKQFFGENEVTIKGGVAGSSTFGAKSLKFKFIIEDTCADQSISLTDADAFISVNNEPIGTTIVVDISLRKAAPLELSIDTTKIEGPETKVCGELTFSVEATEAGTTSVLSHASINVETKKITLNYSSWSSSATKRIVNVVLKVQQDSYPTVVSHLITITEVDCSKRFEGQANPADFGVIPLNTNAKTIWSQPYPVNQLTEAECKNSEMMTFQASGPNNSPTWIRELAWVKVQSDSFNSLNIIPTFDKTFAGEYQIYVLRGDTYTSETIHDLTVDFTMCWIDQPDVIGPFYIDVANTKKTSLQITIPPLTINDPGKCGNIIYKASSSDSDVFTTPKATNNQNVLTFTDIQSYSLGTFNVDVQVRQHVVDESDPAHTIKIQIHVLDCRKEAYTYADMPSVKTYELIFPFSQVITFRERLVFTKAIAEIGCKPFFEYRITCTDHQYNLNEESPTQHATKTSAQTVHQKLATLKTQSDPCSKFNYDATYEARTVTIDSSAAAYSGVNKPDYEGEYHLKGQLMHESLNSDDIYGYSGAPEPLSFIVKIKLNCDEVVIIPPAGKLKFTIEPPATAPNMQSPGGSFESDALFHWARSSKSYPLHGVYVNPHPYSCTLEHKLGETSDNGLTFDNTRSLADLYLTFTITGGAPIIKSESTANKFWKSNKQEAVIMYEASLKDSTSKLSLTFKYFAFMDCLAHSNEWVLSQPTQLETINKEYDIDGLSNAIQITITEPKFLTSFSLPNVCPLKYKLKHLGETEAQFLSGIAPVDPIFKCLEAEPCTVLQFKAGRNQPVKRYSHPSDIVQCDLGVPGTENCSIDYTIQVSSTNSTIVVSTQGTVEVRSECLSIGKNNAGLKWELSKQNKDILHPNIAKGYQVRSIAVGFDLPFIRPTLASGDDIFDRCGPLVYVVGIESENPDTKSFIQAFQFLMADDLVYDSAQAIIETDEQKFAIESGEPHYTTEYKFTLTTQFNLYGNNAGNIFTYGPIPFAVRDYCAELTINGPPLLEAITDNFSLTQQRDADTNQLTWVNSINKNLLSGVSVFVMDYLTYTEYQPPDSTSPQIVYRGDKSTVCGQLQYKLIHRSWEDLWNSADIMNRPVGDSYFAEMGTLHIINAEKRFQIGNHVAKIEARTDLEIKSTSQDITFEIEVMDCRVNYFDRGVQNVKDTMLAKGDEMFVKLFRFEQIPECNFPVEYTVTLVEKAYGSGKKIAFPKNAERTQPLPKLVTIDFDSWMIKISPTADIHEGKEYAVFIKGNLAVNETIQEPMSEMIEFDLVVLSSGVTIKNNAVKLQDPISSLVVIAGSDSQYVVGVPFDDDGDSFIVTEWGVQGEDEIPKWVKLLNTTIESGIKFKLKPTEENIGETLTVFYTIRDDNYLDPTDSKFTFVVNVKEGFIDQNFNKTGTFTQEEIRSKIVRVNIVPPDSDGKLQVIFSKPIKLPSNCAEWTNTNEGADRILIELVTSTTTENLLDEQDLIMQMIWSIDEVIFAEKADSENVNSRRLQDKNIEKSDDQFVEVKQLTYQLSFTEPTLISRQSHDSVNVEIGREMFQDEDLALLEEQEKYIEQNKIEFVKTRHVAQQLNPTMVAISEEFAGACSNSLQAFFGANLFVSFFSAYLLQYLWGLINSLQMIVLTTLFDVTIPFNAHMIMITVLQMVSLEFINTDPVLEDMFDFRETEAFETVIDEYGEPSSKFADAGYESANYLQLLGSIFFIVLIYIAWQTIRLLVNLIESRIGNVRLTRLVRQTTNQKLVIIRFLLETCVELGLSAFIQVLMTDREIFESKDETIAYILAVLTLCSLIAAPIVFVRMTLRYLNELQKEEAERKISKESQEVFEGYRDKCTALFYPCVFFLRRYATLLVLTLLPRHRYVQIIAHLHTTGFAAFYIMTYHPFDEPQKNKMEAFNELVVLIAAYPLLLFMNPVISIEMQSYIAWFLVACICLTIICNMGALFYVIFRQMQQKIIRCMNIRKYKAMLIKREKERQAKILADQMRKTIILGLFNDQMGQKQHGDRNSHQVEVVFKKDPLAQLGDLAQQEDMKQKLADKPAQQDDENFQDKNKLLDISNVERYLGNHSERSDQRKPEVASTLSLFEIGVAPGNQFSSAATAQPLSKQNSQRAQNEDQKIQKHQQPTPVINQQVESAVITLDMLDKQVKKSRTMAKNQDIVRAAAKAKKQEQKAAKSKREDISNRINQFEKDVQAAHEMARKGQIHCHTLNQEDV